MKTLNQFFLFFFLKIITTMFATHSQKKKEKNSIQFCNYYNFSIQLDRKRENI